MLLHNARKQIFRRKKFLNNSCGLKAFFLTGIVQLSCHCSGGVLLNFSCCLRKSFLTSRSSDKKPQAPKNLKFGKRKFLVSCEKDKGISRKSLKLYIVKQIPYLPL